MEFEGLVAFRGGAVISGRLAESRGGITGCECAVREELLLEVGATFRRGFAGYPSWYSQGLDVEKKSAFEYLKRHVCMPCQTFGSLRGRQHAGGGGAGGAFTSSLD